MKAIFFLVYFFYSAFGEPIFLGNPYSKEYKSGEMIYARNIWDMQLYKDKIYIGGGNSSNYSPAKNAGRVNVVSLNPKDDSFTNEYRVAEEQIDIFKVYGDILYIAGHDATQKWDFGNIYRKYENQWYKNRTLPNALHVYDIVAKGNKIFTAVGLNNKGAVFISDKKAINWKQLIQAKHERVYSFLEIGDELFATQIFRKSKIKKVSMTQYNPKYNTFSPRFDLNTAKMFPDTKLQDDGIKIIKNVNFENKALYIGAYKHNDHQNLPFGLYLASLKNKELQVQKIDLEKESIPKDILVRKDAIYVLVSKNQKEKTTIQVLKFVKNDFNHHEKIISFLYNSFARSFEELHGCFYFGIGSEIANPNTWNQNELKKETGDILKLCLAKEN